MDQLVNQLFQKEVLFLALLVVIGTFFIRRIVETAVPSCKAKETKFGLWWGSVILYAIPVVLGSLTAVAAYGVFLPDDIKTRAGAALWGVVIGWFSSFLYKVVRKILITKTGIDPTPTPADADVTKKLVKEDLEKPVEEGLGKKEKSKKLESKEDDKPEKDDESEEEDKD